MKRLTAARGAGGAVAGPAALAVLAAAGALLVTVGPARLRTAVPAVDALAEAASATVSGAQVAMPAPPVHRPR